MAKPKRKNAPLPTRPSQRVMNPLVTLRAQTIPDKRKQASKQACRKKASYE